MHSEHPWIDAALESFPKDDPKNERRRELLLEASSASALPSSQEELRPSHIPRPSSFKRALALDIFFGTAALILLGLMIVGPSAQQRIRGIVVADEFSSYGWQHYSGPLRKIYGEQFPKSIDSSLLRRLPPNKHLECLGDPTHPNRQDRWEAYWEADPHDPVRFAERFRSSLDSSPTDPPSLEQARSIDPGNGYFEWLLGVQGLEPAIDLRRARSSSTSPIAGQWQVTDPAAFAESWSRIRSGLQAPRFEDYAEAVTQRRLSGWPSPIDFTDLTHDAIWFQYQQPTQSGYFLQRMEYLLGAFQLRAEAIVTAGDRNAMLELCTLWRKLIALPFKPSKQPSSQILDRWTTYFVLKTAAPMSAACDELELEEEAAFFERADNSVGRDPFPSPKNIASSSRLTDALQIWGFQGNRDPGRLAEHSMFESLYLTAMLLLALLVLGLIGGIRFVLGFDLERLPAHLTGFCPPGAQLRLLIAASIVPMTYLSFHLWQPILHPREESFGDLAAGGLALKGCAALVASIALSFAGASRCLRNHAAPLGFQARCSLPLMTLALGCFLLHPLASLLQHFDDLPFTDDEGQVWIGLFSFLGLGLIGLVAWLATLAFGTRSKLHAATILRIATPSVFATAALFALLAIHAQQQERTHVARAHLERIDTPESFARGRHLASAEDREAVLQLLETAP